MKPVEYTAENVAKCWCGQCPVQKSSQCAKDTYAEAEKVISSGGMPERGTLPGLYCASGKATCDDIEPVERCLCAQCLVYGEHSLLANHYCVLGDAPTAAG